MRNFTILASFLFAFGSFTQAQNPFFAGLEGLTQAPIFGSSPFQDSIWGFDRTSYNIVYRSGPKLAGGTITGLNSVTVHPCTDEIYVVFKQSAVTGRLLGIFNPKTDTVTTIGNMGVNISSITFHSNGTLFAVSGDGATPSETLFTVDPTTAVLTIAATLGNGADGEVIAYNPDDDMIYHFSGNGTVIMESFPSAAPYTPITPISAALGSGGETFGAVYMGGGEFLIGNISSNLRMVSTTGVVGPVLVNTPDDIRGLANIGRWLNLTGPSSWCPNEVTGSLEAEGGEAYQWTVDGASIPGATDSVHVPALTGWYNCLITKDTLNCTSSPADTAWFGKQITIFNLPGVSLTPAGTAYLCAVGDSIQITATGGGTSQWYMNGVMVAGATTNSYYATGPGIYNMEKTNQNGCTDSSAVSTVVMYAPTGAGITPNGTDTLCEPNTVTIVATAGAQSYQWLDGGNPIAGETNDSLVVSTSGVYSCVVSYGACDETTTTFDVSILDCSGLDELSAEVLSLYPNPATSEIHLSLVEMGSYKGAIYSALGALVKTFEFDGSEHSLNIADLPNGSYVISVNDGTETFRRQFVKH